jgi:hypothetical protein
MKRVVIKRIAVVAALVVSSAANAATYNYTENYVYVRKPMIASAQRDAQLQEDAVTCNNAVGPHHGMPSASYRSCMLQHGWKFSSLTRTRVQAAPADPYFSSNAKVAPGHFIDHDKAWTARTRAAPGFAIPLMARCTISTRTRTCPARAPVRCPFARTCEQWPPADFLPGIGPLVELPFSGLDGAVA